MTLLYNPNNIQEAWPQDIVKESEDISGSKNEEGSEMRVKGQYIGKVAAPHPPKSWPPKEDAHGSMYDTGSPQEGEDIRRLR